MKKIQKGFTLIELLIVIAIIGILAGVILVSTSTARQKAQIAAAKSTLKGAMPYVVACIASGGTPQAFSAGSNLCNDFANVNTKWPAAPAGCGTPSLSLVANTLTVANCGGSGTTDVTCNIQTGGC